MAYHSNVTQIHSVQSILEVCSPKCISLLISFLSENSAIIVWHTVYVTVYEF